MYLKTITKTITVLFLVLLSNLVFCQRTPEYYDSPVFDRRQQSTMDIAYQRQQRIPNSDDILRSRPESLPQDRYRHQDRYRPSYENEERFYRPQEQPNINKFRPQYSDFEDVKVPVPINPVTSFSLKLLKNIPTNVDSNLIVSPISAQFLLSLLEKGAGGETKRQLQIVLGSKTGEELNRILKDDTKGLKTALGIFYDNQISLHSSYRKKTDSLATIKDLNFQGKSLAAKEHINNWASDNTEGKIKDLISEDYDLSGVNLVLVSAIYFHNTWKYKFQPIGDNQFTNAKQNVISVPFMEFTQNIVLYETDFNGVKCTVICLPYENEKYAMVLLIPKSFLNLDGLFQNIDISTLNDILSTTEEKYQRFVNLKMPKFKMETRNSLVHPLRKMELTEIFGSHSNLTGISTGNLYVSEILQQATLDVDENGTVAAAATSGLLVPLSADSKPRPFKYVIDKPFVSIILDTENKTPLFISKVNDPRS